MDLPVCKPWNFMILISIVNKEMMSCVQLAGVVGEPGQENIPGRAGTRLPGIRDHLAPVYTLTCEVPCRNSSSKIWRFLLKCMYFFYYARDLQIVLKIHTRT
jgi:hypothetical protein